MITLHLHHKTPSPPAFQLGQRLFDGAPERPAFDTWGSLWRETIWRGTSDRTEPPVFDLGYASLINSEPSCNIVITITTRLHCQNSCCIFCG
jgi:hypothetical protein